MPSNAYLADFASYHLFWAMVFTMHIHGDQLLKPPPFPQYFHKTSFQKFQWPILIISKNECIASIVQVLWKKNTPHMAHLYLDPCIMNLDLWAINWIGKLVIRTYMLNGETCKLLKISFAIHPGVIPLSTFGALV